jgi:hypothetical protein
VPHLGAPNLRHTGCTPGDIADSLYYNAASSVEQWGNHGGLFSGSDAGARKRKHSTWDTSRTPLVFVLSFLVVVIRCPSRH